MSFDLVFGNKENPETNDALCSFAAQHIWGSANDFGPCGSLGVTNQGKLIAVVVFHNWHDDHGVIELSAAAIDPRWLTRKVIRTVMNICFAQHGCQQIVSRIAVENERTLKIYRYLGFSGILLPNMRGSGRHEMLMLLTFAQWRGHKLYEVQNG